MILRPDQERVRLMLKDTITLLCKNGLTFKKKFSIEAVIGVTLDEDDVFLISMNEIVKSTLDNTESLEASSSEEPRQKSKRRHRKRPHVKTKRAESDSSEAKGSDVTNPSGVDVPSTYPAKRPDIKEEPDDIDDDGSGDLVFIKHEMDNSWLPSGLEVEHGYNNTNVSGNLTDIHSSRDLSSLSDMTLMPVGSSQDVDSSLWIPSSSNQQQQFTRRGRPPTLVTTLATAGTSQSGDVAEGREYPGESSESQQQADQSDLHQHMFSCSVGSKICSSRYSLMRHQSSHDGIEPQDFVCSMCNKRFTLKSNWKRHERSHFGIFPYKCKICHKGFYGNERIQSHMASAHEVPVCSGNTQSDYLPNPS